MSNQKFEMIFKDAVSPIEGGYLGFNPRIEKAMGMIIEYDFAVRMRDGVRIYIDVYRPETDGKYPVIINWGPYGKFGRITYSRIWGTPA